LRSSEIPAAALDPALLPVLDQALERAALDWHIVEWPELTLATRDRVRRHLEPAVFSRLEKLVAISYSPSRLRGAIRRGVASRRGPEPLDRFLSFYRTEPGRSVALEQNRSFTAAQLRVQPEILAGWLRHPLAGLRLDAIRRLDETMHLSDDVTRVAIEISRAISSAGHALACSTGSAKPAVRVVERFRPLVQGRMRFTLEFVHGERSAQDLSIWLRFARGEAGRWLYKDIHQELAIALEVAAAEFHQQVAVEARARCGDQLQ